MEEQIQHLIEVYEKRYHTCLQMLKEAETLDGEIKEAEKRYYRSLSLLWKTVINDLQEIRR